MKIFYWTLGSILALVSVFGALALAVPVTFPPTPPPFVGITRLATPVVNTDVTIESATCHAVNVGNSPLNISLSIRSSSDGVVEQTTLCEQ